jgi:hypothetical protein
MVYRGAASFLVGLWLCRLGCVRAHSSYHMTEALERGHLSPESWVWSGCDARVRVEAMTGEIGVKMIGIEDCSSEPSCGVTVTLKDLRKF